MKPNILINIPFIIKTFKQALMCYHRRCGQIYFIPKSRLHYFNSIELLNYHNFPTPAFETSLIFQNKGRN